MKVRTYVNVQATWWLFVAVIVVLLFIGGIKLVDSCTTTTTTTSTPIDQQFKGIPILSDTENNKAWSYITAEIAFFEGQREALEGDIRIEQGSDGIYHWTQSPWGSGTEATADIVGYQKRQQSEE